MAEGEEKVLKMSLICSICLQKLTKPRCVPCFHTFCEACLKNYLINAPEKENATKNGIPCPVCRSIIFSPKHALSVDKWAENFPMNQLAGTLIDLVPMSSKIEFCEPCKDNKESKVAKNWCKECAEALCDECAKCHGSMKATKNHELSPLEAVRSNPQTTFSEEVPCYEHNRKDIDMYCEDHEMPCCVVCVATNHRKCDKMYPLAEYLNRHAESVDPNRLLKEIDTIVSDADSIKRERQEVVRNSQGQKMKMLQDIADAKAKLIKHIEKLESQISTKFNAVAQTDSAIMQEQIDYCNSVQSAMAHSKTAIKTAKDQNIPKKQFIVCQQSKKKCDECAVGLKRIHENAAKVYYGFEVDRQVQDILTVIQHLGKLDVKHSYPNRKPETPKLPPTPVQLPEDDDEKKAARKLKSFNAKIRGDKRDCKITAIKIWNSQRALIVDNGNSKLKLFGEFGDVQSSFNCQHPPWDFAFLDKTKVAVTFPNDRRIKIFSIKESTISEKGYVQTTRGCHGVCVADDDLVVTFTSGCIRVIALDGTIKTMVETDYIGKKVFSNPEYIAYNHWQSILYVSDYNNHTITALRYDNGKVDQVPVFVYPVSGPRGICLDNSGNLFVCGFWSNDVHMVSGGGELKQILKDSLARPTTIGFSTDGEKFALVEQGNSNMVKMFSVIPDSESDDY